MLVLPSGAIPYLNKAARELFSEPDDNAPRGLTLDEIWSIENGRTWQQFLADWPQAQPSVAQLKFKARRSRAESYATALCKVEHDTASGVLMQLISTPVDLKSDKPSSDRQKLERVFQLTRTLTHDLNNALTGVLGNTSLLLSKTEKDSPLRPLLLELEKACNKAADIAGDLGTFSRQEKGDPATGAGNIKPVIQGAVDAVRQHTAARDPIEWELHDEKQLYAIRFDEKRLQPALVKILENAVEALRKARSIAVHISNLDVREATQDRGVQLAAGKYVCVEVKDTGVGIDAETLPRVFEPFFTTKHGQHRGLGLALAYGIVSNVGGCIAISSEKEVGTSVRIYLPAESRYVEQDALSEPAAGNGQTVLVVDDEELLLVTQQAILSSHGYEVLVASAGEKAMKVLEKRSADIKLVVTDLVMPGMNGRELMERINRQYPWIPVLCTTGTVWAPGQQPKDRSYLRKPFTAQQLIGKVASMLQSTKIDIHEKHKLTD